MAHTYLDPLPGHTTLEVFAGDKVVFSSQGKWLHPLFDLDGFVEEHPAPKEGFSAHDTAIGKAAAVLMVRFGVKKIHANLASRLARTFIDETNGTRREADHITLTADRWVDRLLCATEAELEDLHDPDEMYFLLRRRARLVQGVPVEAKELTAPYGSVKNLSFSLQAGDHLMVTGENGSGKTTLLKIICGLLKPSGGSVRIDGKPVGELAHSTIGYIPQISDESDYPLSVEEVVSLGLDRKAPKDAIDKALKRVGALSLKGRDFNSLSGGEKQKVSLARCLAQRARLLLFDEPTAAMDSGNRKMTSDILSSLTVSEIPTIIVVTHDPALASLPGWKRLDLDA